MIFFLCVGFNTELECVPCELNSAMLNRSKFEKNGASFVAFETWKTILKNCRGES
jgi:hypothetical protein